MVAAPLMTQMRMGTRMQTSVTNLKAAARRYRISTRLETRRGVSTFPAMVAVSNRSRRSKSRKSKLAPRSAKEAILIREGRLLLRDSRSLLRGRASRDPAINRTRCRPTNTTTICLMKRSRSSALSKLRNETWSNNQATVITLASP